MSQEQTIYGPHAVLAALARETAQITVVWIDVTRKDARTASLIQLAHKNGISVQPMKRADLNNLVPGAKHQGVVALCRVLPVYVESDIPIIIAKQDTPLLLILDGVQDPHNLGACLRCADGAGVCAVIAPKDRAVTLTATVHKVAAGAAEHIPFITVTNLARTMRMLKQAGIWLVGAVDDAAGNIYGVDLQGPVALVMGGEGKGLRRLTRELCDYLVSIPMAGVISSLNVSVATGICLYEVVRQRNQSAVAILN